VRYTGLDDEQIEVTVGPYLTASRRAEEPDPVRVGHFHDAANDLCQDGGVRSGGGRRERI